MLKVALKSIYLEIDEFKENSHIADVGGTQVQEGGKQVQERGTVKNVDGGMGLRGGEGDIENIDQR